MYLKSCMTENNKPQSSHYAGDLMHFLSRQDRMWMCSRLKKEYPLPWINHPPQNRTVVCVSALVSPTLCTSLLSWNQFSSRKKQETYALYCVQFPRFSRLLSDLHNEGHDAAEFPSYHKLACMAPLLSPQSSSNWCNWTSPLLSSKQRSSIAYAPNTLDNESYAAGQEGRLARCCSVNTFQSH